MSGEPLRGALVGAGKITPFHLQAWERISQAAIVAIADPDVEKAQARAQEFGIGFDRVYASLAEVLQAEKRLDFVDIATPPHVRLEPVKLAAAHGLHVLCQKPFARDLAEAQAMIVACKRAGVVLSVNENWRWRSWYREIKEMIAAGRVGRPIYARIACHGSGSLRRRATLPSDREPPTAFGFLFHWGIHLVDVLRFLFGEVDSVYARLERLDRQQSREDWAVITLGFGELTALIDISCGSHAPYGCANRTQHNVEDVRIEGDAGAILLLQDPGKGDLMRVTTQEGEWEQPAYDGKPIEAYRQSYVSTQCHFVDCLLTGSTPETHGEDNLRTLAVTLAAYHSAEHNTVVHMEDYVEAEKIGARNGKD